MTSNHLFKLAQEVADSLSKIDGVLAVALGGSLARGTAHPDSDIDLGLYYDPTILLLSLCSINWRQR